ncbi:hypothetical protein [Pinisolibacter sp.]|uniref:hypothetical protein n=1 Tax=Pinisolibacter sp. TaxID=2172024 RepID=UPI002FDCEEE1
MRMNTVQTKSSETPFKNAVRALFSDPREKAFIFAMEGGLIRSDDLDETRFAAEELADLLGELSSASDGAVAVLSDRPLAETDRLLAPLSLPGCGSSGLELRIPGGAHLKLRIEADLDPVRRFLDGTLRGDTLLGVDDDGLSIALTHGGEPEAVERARVLAREAVSLAPAAYRVRFEEAATRITFAGVSKARAVRRLMSCDYFIERIPVVFGGRVCDDDVYSVVRSFGGTAIQVGSRDGHCADIQVPGSNDVRWLIRDFLADLGDRVH